MKFKIKKTDNKSKARLGELKTDHGKIETPIFMPVGTAGTIKGIHQQVEISILLISIQLIAILS